MSRLRHDLAPLDVEKFMAAVAAGRQSVKEWRDKELAEMPAGQPVLEPEKFRTRQWGDDEASRFVAAIDAFDGDTDLALSCSFRNQFVMRLITKRKYRRFRRGHGDGGFSVNETFVRAVCEMPLTQSMVTKRKLVKRALSRAIRRLEAAERAKATGE